MNEILGSFTKGLSHDSTGLAANPQFDDFKAALKSHDVLKFRDFCNTLTTARPLVNPTAAWSCLSKNELLPATSNWENTYSLNTAQEMIRVYKMAKYRDVDFDTLEAGPIGTSLRATFPGCNKGYYTSQFMLIPVTIGKYEISQKISVYQSGIDFMKTNTEWVNIQNGNLPTGSTTIAPAKKYIKDFRAGLSFVHDDKNMEFLNTAYWLTANGFPFNPGNPFAHSYLPNQGGFVNHWLPMVCSIVEETLQMALRLAWKYKWKTNLRCRPEAYAGIVEHYPELLPHVGTILADTDVSSLISTNGNALLPMGFPEGSPMHPSTPAGHATVSIACITALKMLYDGSVLFPSLVKPDATGATLNTGLPNVDNQTVNDELNKLAANISQWRNAAGVHFDSDMYSIVTEAEMLAEYVWKRNMSTVPEKVHAEYVNMAGETRIVTL